MRLKWGGKAIYHLDFPYPTGLATWRDTLIIIYSVIGAFRDEIEYTYIFKLPLINRYAINGTLCEREKGRVGEKCKYSFVVALCHIHFLVVAYRFVAWITLTFTLTLTRAVRAESTCMQWVELFYFCQFSGRCSFFMCAYKKWNVECLPNLAENPKR